MDRPVDGPFQANDLQDGDVLNLQNLLIRRHFDGRRARVSHACTDALLYSVCRDFRRRV